MTVPEASPPTIYVQPQTWQEQIECWRMVMCASDPERMEEEAIHSRKVTLQKLKAKWEIKKMQIHHQSEMEMQKTINEERKEERRHELAMRELEYRLKKLHYYQNKTPITNSPIENNSHCRFDRRRCTRLYIRREFESDTREVANGVVDDISSTTDDEEGSHIGGGDPEDYCRRID